MNDSFGKSFGKSQPIRLIDVFFLGPFMMYYGYKMKNEYKNSANLMILFGLLTILYNGYNFLNINNPNKYSPLPL